MVIGKELDDVITAIGHDGSDIQWPAAPEPLRRRGFYHNEIMLAALSFGWTLAAFFPSMDVISMENGDSVRRTLSEDQWTLILKNLCIFYTCDPLTNRNHVVAWDGQQVYDPDGRIYPIRREIIETLWVAKRSEIGVL